MLMSWLALTALLVLSSCSCWMLAGGQTCSLSASDFSLRIVTVSAESVDGSTPGVRVTWSTTVPPECVASVTVEFRTSSSWSVVRSYTTTSTSGTEVIQTGLQCPTTYYISVAVNGGPSLGVLMSRRVQVIVGDIPAPVRVRAEVTADNTSIRVLWEWSNEGLLMCVESVRVDYQPEGGSLMMYTVDNATATSATLSNLQCNTQYTISVYAEGGRTGKRSITRVVSLPARVPSGTPQSLEVTPVQLSEVYLSWREVPCDQQNGPITGYVVRYYATCGPDRDVQQTKSVVTTGSIIDGLTPNTEYAFQVAAVNTNGTGPFSEPVTLGGAPQSVMVSPVNFTTATVSWSEVQCFNGSGAVTHYLVQYHSMSGGIVQNVTTHDTVQTISGLALNAAMYTFQVAAVGTGGVTGPFSNPAIPGGVPVCLQEEEQGGVPVCPQEGEQGEPTSTQCTTAWAVTGVAIAAVLVLLAVVIVESAIIWYQQRSISKIESQLQSVYSAIATEPSGRATSKSMEIPMKECSAYGQIDQVGGDREETHIYEHTQ